MSPRANVRSLDAIRYFRPAVIRFQDDVAAALNGLRTECSRTLQWLDHDCPAYWQQQVRGGFDKVAETRTALTRKQMITVAGHKADCIDEKKAFARAKQQLELAQEKVRVCRQWSVKAHRASDEYNARIGRAEQRLLQDLPRMLAILERIVLALEAYSATDRRPTTSSVAHWDDVASPVAATAPVEAPAGEAAAAGEAAPEAPLAEDAREEESQAGA